MIAKQMIRSSFVLAISFLAALQPAPAAIKMPAIFGDHMVLQEDTKIPVWGWAAAGETVTVTFGGKSVATTTAADGTWRIDLPPVPANTAPQTLTIAGADSVTFQDVVVGDVWLASGQSNMDFGIGNVEHAADEIAKANEPQLRLFCVPHATSLTPLKDLAPATGDIGKWVVCSPDTVVKAGPWSGFSAVAYYFGREIQHATGHSVGMIDTCWGGTAAQSWVSLDGLQKDPALAHYVADHQKAVANFPTAQAVYPKLLADYQTAKAKWDAEVGASFWLQRSAWDKQVAAAQAKGVAPPPGEGPQPSRPMPQEPTTPDGGAWTPTNLYNGMIAPLQPLALKGAIWYQGESNAGSPQSGAEYSILFPRLIKDWREKWAQGDFPFLYVQLASFGDPASTPSQDSWPYLREAQLETLSVPQTGMAVAVDIGNPYNIHPADKLDVGLRLALAARHVAYGQDIVYSGPIYDSMQLEGNKIILSFKNVGGGLKVGTPPWTLFPVIRTPSGLTGFGIAGADKKFVWAQAVIQGDKIVVSSDQVPAPVAVRYGWANTPPVNLYNQENLPASPFRTDHWD
jgi:sialate O-acetylesterase